MLVNLRRREMAEQVRSMVNSSERRLRPPVKIRSRVVVKSSDALPHGFAVQRAWKAQRHVVGESKMTAVQIVTHSAFIIDKQSCLEVTDRTHCAGLFSQTRDRSQITEKDSRHVTFALRLIPSSRKGRATCLLSSTTLIERGSRRVLWYMERRMVQFGNIRTATLYQKGGGLHDRSDTLGSFGYSFTDDVVAFYSIPRREVGSQELSVIPPLGVHLPFKVEKGSRYDTSPFGSFLDIVFPLSACLLSSTVMREKGEDNKQMSHQHLEEIIFSNFVCCRTLISFIVKGVTEKYL